MMMQKIFAWAAMDGYGGYVWSVLALLIVVIAYETLCLKATQRRHQRALTTLNELAAAPQHESRP